MSLTLYKGPTTLDLDAFDNKGPFGAFAKVFLSGDTLVTMDQTDTMLRFDILRRVSDTAKWEQMDAYVFNLVEDKNGTKSISMLVGGHHEVVAGESGELEPFTYRQFAKEHHDYLNHLTNAILDTSAHKVVKTRLLRFFRQVSRVDSFDFISDSDTVTLHLIYPQLKQYNWNRYYNLSSNKTLERSLRKNTVEEMVKSYFGKHFYRKDLVKAVAQVSRLETLVFIDTLKNNIPIDWTIKILQKNAEVQGNIDRFDARRAVEFYNAMTAKQFRKFAKCLAEEDILDLNMIDDMARLYLEDMNEDQAFLDRIKFRSIEEFHHALLQIHGAIEKERERKARFSRYMVDLPETKASALLKTVEWEGAPYDVVFPKQAVEIYEWGTAAVMNNCIGGYAFRMRDYDDTALFALYRDDKPFVNIEANLSSGYRHVDNENEVVIDQFQGKKNSRVQINVVRDFSFRLILAGLITQTNSLPDYTNIFNGTPYNTVEDVIEAYKSTNETVNQFIERTLCAKTK